MTTPSQSRADYRWLWLLLGLALLVSVLLVYAQNRVYEPATPFLGGTGDHYHAFALDPYQPDHMYIGSHYGFFRTTNGGTRWTRLNGAGGIEADLVATSLSISPIDSKTTYVTGYTLGSGNAAGVYVTTDDGANWHQLPIGLPGSLPTPRILFVAAGWSGNGEAYAYSIDAGLFRTNDRGAHWGQVAPPFSGQVTTFVPLLACPADGPAAEKGSACPEELLVGTTQGLFAAPASPDTSALTFAAVPEVPDYVYAIAAHRGTDPAIYISTQRGLYTAASPVDTFTPLTSVAQGAPTFTNLAVSGGDAHLVYGVTRENIVQRSMDGGQHWQPVAENQLNRGLSQLSSGLRQATGSQTPQWAGGQNIFLTILQAPIGATRTVYVAISFPNQLFQSTDDGTHWRDIAHR